MKRIASLLMTFFIVLGALTLLPTDSRAESLYIRKIVSVVYDDSGSMTGDKWAYANYAMQTFCGMLNSEDQLYITYMSKAANFACYSPEKIDLSSNGIQASVDSIRNHTYSSITPLAAVDLAFKKLKSVDDSNPNTQYWLVVITDGEFNEIETRSKEDQADALDEYFGDCVEIDMPNGSKPQVTFLAIGKDYEQAEEGEDCVAYPEQDEAKGIYTHIAEEADGIIDAMSEMADRVSGRTRLDTGDVKQINDTTIQVSSSIPLLNIAVLSQGAQANIVGAKHETEGSLPVTRGVSLEYPGYADLVGGAFLVGDSQSAIGDGTYEITFDSAVKFDDLVVLFEPALELRMSLILNGEEIDDWSVLDGSRADDVIDVSCSIYEMGTDNKIDPSLLPQNTKYEVAVYEGGNKEESSSSSDMTLEGYELTNTETEVRAQVTIKGFNPITVTTGKFTPAAPIVYTVEAEKSGEISLTMDELKENEDKVYFTVYADGTPLTKEEVEDMPFSIETDMPGETVYEDDGRISFRPVYRDPVTAIPTGDVEVVGRIGSASATATLYVKPIEYTVRVVSDDGQSVYRNKLNENETGVEFEIYADGKKLDKAAMEAADIKYTLNEKYDGIVNLDVSITDDGTALAVPIYDGWGWLAAYTVPTGELEITAETFSASDTGSISIESDVIDELIWNWLIPLIILLVIIGEIFKYRFDYFSRIHYNRGESTGNMVTGPRSGWYCSGLFSLSALIPFIPDRKKINGVKFYAGSFPWGAKVISVKEAQLPEYSGVLDGGISEQESVRFNKNDVQLIEEGEKKRDMIRGSSLVTSNDPNYKRCNVYLYSDH